MTGDTGSRILGGTSWKRALAKLVVQLHRPSSDPAPPLGGNNGNGNQFPIPQVPLPNLQPPNPPQQPPPIPLIPIPQRPPDVLQPPIPLVKLPQPQEDTTADDDFANDGEANAGLDDELSVPEGVNDDNFPEPPDIEPPPDPPPPQAPEGDPDAGDPTISRHLRRLEELSPSRSGRRRFKPLWNTSLPATLNKKV
eukprot:scaffold20213_cov51-Cylindrotheca_fusiformis.AAC.1